jgi:hypothetical protein
VSGHVFHPGHEALHGVTVVVSDLEGKTYVGRYHETGPRGILLHDVAIFDPSVSSLSREVWLARQKKFGVEVARRSVTIPAETASQLTRFHQAQ